MKKNVLFVLLAGLSFLSFSAQAQYGRGDLLLNGGISVGLIGYNYYGNYSGFPALTASLEYSLDDRWAVGPYLGYFSRTYTQNFGGNSYKHGMSVFAFGGRGTFHATSSINDWFDATIDEEKLDIYASAILGFETYSWSYDDDFDFDHNNRGGRVILGPVVGIRYFFNPQVGAYFETGRGTFGLATLGVSVRL